MANPEHLHQLFLHLRGGAEAWNIWRKEHSDVELDFSGHKFEGMLRHNLRNLDFKSANLSQADFNGCTLDGADLSNSNLWRADLSRASLLNVNLDGAELIDANLSNASLVGASLVEANLSFAYLTHAIFDGARLLGATLNEARADRTSFRKAELEGVRFVHTLLSYSDLSGANLHSAMWCNTVFGETELDGVTGLDSCLHAGPSILDYGTIEISKDLPQAFLRGCGLPDTLIEYIPPLFNDPIQFYSCFISYSTKDEDFARRLYSRMRDEHLRVWFSPEDIKGGEKLYEQVDRAIQIHDRLLIILSESSVQSKWVMTEIRRARRAESRENRRKLFPIRLVDFDALQAWECFDADTGEDLAAEVRQYFIPDFSNWKDHDAFERAFDKLLRDLRAEEKS